MTYKQLKIEGYYVARRKGWDTWYIKPSKIDFGNTSIYTSISFTKDNYYGNESNIWANDIDEWTYTEVSKEEREWMDACGKAGKVIEKSLINNKSKTMTTAITPAKARVFPTKDLVDGQKFQTKQGEIEIVKQKSGQCYVLCNIPTLNGGMPRSKRGYTNGWNLYSGATVDLTCGGKLTAIKKVEGVTEEEFAQNFRVSGTKGLLKAFKEDAQELGWKFVGKEISGNGRMVFDKGEFWVGNDSVDDGTYELSYEFGDALDAAGDKRAVDKTEYLLCISDEYVTGGVTKGRIYKRDISEEDPDEDDGYCIMNSDRTDGGEDTYFPRSIFVPSTKEAFEAQGPNISSVQGYKINIQTVKINGYHEMKMACIGCQSSEQVYSRGALETLRDVMCNDEAEFYDEGVVFTKEQVEALIEALS